MTRGRREGILQNRVLIGALTVLVTIVAVTLAYQANNGLPFVPRYVLHVHVADAEELTRGGEVHMGGALVGTVQSVDPARSSTGRPIAQLNLSLNKTVDPLAVDTLFTIRLKASIGLKYLDITPGHSSKTWTDGATVPLSQTSADVDLDQLFSMFDPATRAGVQATTTGFADALASRGTNINDAIGAFLPLVRNLGPVARNLSAQQTDLGGFFRGLERFTGALVPVSAQQASMFVNLDTTFHALATVAVPFLQNWISETPPTFQTVIDDSPAIQGFVKNTTGLFAELRPAFATLPISAPILADAFAAGAKNLPGTTELNKQTVALSNSLAAYSANPTVSAGLSRLTLTLQSLRPPLSYLTPTQATCNYVTLFLRNIASALSDPIAQGTTLRVVPVAIDQVLGGEGVPSHKVYTTPVTDQNAQHGPLHYNPYPYTAAPGQPVACGAGNEHYDGSRALLGQPPNNLSAKTETTTRPGS